MLEKQTYILGIVRGLGLVEPSLKKGLQLAHVLKAQVESFESGDGGLAEVVAVQFAHRHADVALSQTDKEK